MRYLIRVDDYPQGLQFDARVRPGQYPAFHATFEELEVPYCLGVVPALVNAEQIEYLKTLKNVTIAQHGWDHSGAFLHAKENIARQILQGRKILSDFAPEVYIPPFNELGNMGMFDVLHQCGFNVVTGGPGSERILQDIFSIRKVGNILYVPTHKYLYGTSRDILKTYDKIGGDLAGITLHWTWEVGLSLCNSTLRELLTAIKPHVTDWRNMSTKIIPVAEYPMKIANRIPFGLIVETVEPTSRVLDMGSKDSPLPALMARKGCNVTALDLSPNDLRAGLKHADAFGVRYETLCGDFFEHATGNPYDYITGCYSFGENPRYLGRDYSRNTDEIKKQFEKASALLKPGGKLLLALPFTKQEKAWVNYERGDPMFIFNVDAVVNIIAESEFKINILRYFTYSDRDGTTGFTDREQASAIYVEAERL